MRKFFLLAILLTVLPVFLNAGMSTKQRKLFRKAENHFVFSEYEAALPFYLKLISTEPDNGLYQAKAGICLYYSTTSRALAVPYFDKALKSNFRKTEEIWLHAGLSFLSVNRFDDALNCFREVRRQPGAQTDPELLQQWMNNCETGKKMYASPGRVRIRNVGSNVNSKFPDYAPVLTADQSLMLFTSKRPGTTGGRKDEEGFYFEDIYMSKNMNNKKWNKPARIDSSYQAPTWGPFRFFFAKAENCSELNTNDHDGSITLSPDGNKFYLYRYGDIYEAAYNGKRWERPQKVVELGESRKSFEPSLALSPDGNCLYFVSDRKGSLGGKDIWFIKRDLSGQWSAPINCGPNVNTKWDEESPFVSHDGTQLFFSSQGHEGMGGFDVFSSQRNGDVLNTPVNLGAPINNGGDDVFYITDSTGKNAWYATLNKYGEGDLDIYSVMYYPEVNPLAKLTLEETITNSSLPYQIKFKNLNSGFDTTINLSKGQSVNYNFIPGSKQQVQIFCGDQCTFADTIDYTNTTSGAYCVQRITANEDKSRLIFESWSFDIDQAVDADSVLDLYNDRITARNTLLQQTASGADLNTSSVFNTLAFTWQPQSGIATNTQLLALEGLYRPIENRVNAFAMSPVYFETNEWQVREDMKEELNKLGTWLKDHPAAKVELFGHADSRGDKEYNRKLSLQRAVAVKNYLNILGISEDRITVVGQGESDSGGNEAELRLARKVEVVFILN